MQMLRVIFIAGLTLGVQAVIKRQEPESDQALYGGGHMGINEESDAALYRNMAAQAAHKPGTLYRPQKDESDMALYGGAFLQGKASPMAMAGLEGTACGKDEHERYKKIVCATIKKCGCADLTCALPWCVDYV